MEHLNKRALQLQYVTLAWNVLEGIGSIFFGLGAHSISLVAFGLESGLEVAVSAVVLWNLRDKSGERERHSLLIIGWIYLAVAAYILSDVVDSLIKHEHAQKSLWGIAFLVITVIIMGTLAGWKYVVGKQIGDKTLMADARFSVVDASLAGSVLVGLILTALLGWWWVDQLLAFVIGILAIREGVKELREHWHKK